MAEVHIIGQLTSASGFAKNALLCKWGLQTGGAWKVLAGLKEGQTQVDNPAIGDIAYFSHPIDIHYATRNELVGYGFTHIPSSPGLHNIEVVTWKPSGNLSDTISQHFLGGGHQLKNTELIFSSHERYRLTTLATGKVSAQLHIVLRNFDRFGIEC